MTTFITNGPLNSDEHKAVLIQRSKLAKIAKQIHESDLYVAIHNPRQTGKTTALFELQEILLAEGLGVAYVDLEGRFDLTKPNFYASVANDVRQALAKVLDRSDEDEHPMPQAQDQNSFVQFLKWLSKYSPHAPKLVIMFDEISGVPTDVGKTFFPALRGFQQAGRNKQRKDRDLYQKIVFVFAGALDLHRLMADQNSPLHNICKPYTLDDFNQEEVRTLARNLQSIPPAQVQAIADSIYAWASGHPYFTQTLCAIVEDCPECRNTDVSKLSDLVTQLVEEHVLYTDDVNLAHILKYLRENEDYRAPVFSVLKNTPRKTVARVEDLVSIGILKRQKGSILALRNRIYSERLTNYFADEDPRP
jgi:hypothetical protein